MNRYPRPNVASPNSSPRSRHRRPSWPVCDGAGTRRNRDHGSRRASLDTFKGGNAHDNRARICGTSSIRCDVRHLRARGGPHLGLTGPTHADDNHHNHDGSDEHDDHCRSFFDDPANHQQQRSQLPYDTADHDTADHDTANDEPADHVTADHVRGRIRIFGRE